MLGRKINFIFIFIFWVTCLSAQVVEDEKSYKTLMNQSYGRFEQIEKIDQYLQQVYSRLEKIENKINNFETKVLKDLETRQALIDSKFSEIQKKVNLINEEEYSSIKGKLNGLQDADLRNLKNDVNKIKNEELTGLDKRINLYKESLESLERVVLSLRTLNKNKTQSKANNSSILKNGLPKNKDENKKVNSKNKKTTIK